MSRSNAATPDTGSSAVDDENDGLRWQIVPAILGDLMTDKDTARAKRVAEAMLKMVKLDVATLQKAYQS